MTDQEKPVVLIAEDEPSVAEGYELWLGDSYEVLRAGDGQAALDTVDETVDVVLLDRMMPERSGKEVLQEIRDRGLDCQVIMVTAVEPDFDVVEMGFDAYITKPPEREELLETVDELLDRATRSEAFQTYYSLMARKGALQAQKTAEELADNAAYQELLDRIERARERVDGSLGDMESEMEFVGAIRDIETEDDAELDLDIEGLDEGGLE